jgi:hypothetical protein
MYDIMKIDCTVQCTVHVVILEKKVTKYNKPIAEKIRQQSFLSNQNKIYI